MIIRRATREDVPALCALGAREHAKSRLAHQPYDMARVEISFLSAITGLTSCVFVSEQDGVLGGVVMGIVQPSLFNRFMTAYELLWYAEDGSGVRLLDALKNWAVRMRAIDLVVHNYAGISDPRKFNKAMARKGFEQFGTSYVTPLEAAPTRSAS